MAVDSSELDHNIAADLKFERQRVVSRLDSGMNGERLGDKESFRISDG